MNRTPAPGPVTNDSGSLERPLTPRDVLADSLFWHAQAVRQVFPELSDKDLVEVLQDLADWYDTELFLAPAG